MTRENLLSAAEATDAETSTELPFLYATGMMAWADRQAFVT